MLGLASEINNVIILCADTSGVPTNHVLVSKCSQRGDRVSSSRLKQLRGQQEGREVQHGAVNAIAAEQIRRRWAAFLFTELSVVL